MAGEAEYAFRHALVRDVAYAQMPRASRAEKHELPPSGSPTTATGRPDLVAHHYGEALALGRAAGCGRHARSSSLRGKRFVPRATTRSRWERASRRLRSIGTRSRLWPADDRVRRSSSRSRRLLKTPIPLPLTTRRVWRATRSRPSATLRASRTPNPCLPPRAGRWVTATRPVGTARQRSRQRNGRVRARRSPGAHAAGPPPDDRRPKPGGDRRGHGGDPARRGGRPRGGRRVGAHCRGNGARRTRAGRVGGATESRLHERSRVLNDAGLLHRALNNRANEVFRWRGIAAALPLYEELEELTRRVPTPYAVRWVAATVAARAYMAGDWARALASCRAVLLGPAGQAPLPRAASPIDPCRDRSCPRR